MNKKYTFYNIEVMQKGDLNGYIQGDITFKYNNTEYNHEFLFRFNDSSNGDNNKLVSIDYSYKIPYIEEVWPEIEKYLIDYIGKYKIEKDGLLLIKRDILFQKDDGLLQALLSTGLCENKGNWIIKCENDIKVMKELQKACSEHMKTVKNYEDYKLCFANETDYKDNITIK
ncbi:hypothetical protein [Clostridium estertheticum]|uniref:hypothetical protein n=1 Tax=Clostridium estertheticum TaxID=238834 RepID=UPI001C0D4CDD|nr:hypothetical protein [Clostridium estertheticum]MBU3173259.1 hypothetical protein [Clostridium estertheticum]